MKEKTFLIDGMSCNHCVMAVKKELSSLNLAQAEVEIGKANVKFDETKLDEAQIIEAIKEAGYTVAG